MKLSIVLFAFLFFIDTALPQELGIWQNYTYMNNVSSVDSDSNGFWAAGDGGAYYYSLDMMQVSKKLTKSEGLSSNRITAAAVGSGGESWLGTPEGVIAVYDPKDGSIRKILDIFNSGKNKKGINDIYISGDTAFVSTDFGLSLIDTKTLAFFDTIIKFGNFPAESRVVSATKGSRVNVATEAGIALQKEGSNNLSAPENWDIYTIGNNTVSRVVESNGEIYAATERGLLKIAGSGWDFYRFTNFNVYDLFDFENKLYALLLNTVHLVTETGSEVIYGSGDLFFKSLKIDPKGFYIAADKGVVFTNSADTLLVQTNGPASNSFAALAVDLNNNLWCGSGRDPLGVGFYKFDGIEWSNFNSSNTPEITLNGFHRISVSGDNTVYLSNWGNGFTTFKDNSFVTYNTQNTSLVGIVDDPDFLVVYDVKVDSKGNIWVLNFESADKKPLSVLTTDGNWIHYEIGPPLISDIVIAEYLIIDNNDTKWFAVTDASSSGPGLYYFSDKNTLEDKQDDVWGVIKTGDGLTNERVNALMLDKRGEIWVGTGLGMTVITDPSRPKSSIQNVFGLRQQNITSIGVDPLNQKWVGTLQGVFVMSSDGSLLIEQFDSKNSPLPTDEIKSITFDDSKGIAYIGTDFGLSSVTTYAMEPKTSFDELFVYPNPFLLDSGENNILTIDGLIRNTEIKVLSIDGKLVSQFVSPGGRIATWDGTDDYNNLVSSGIYIIVAYDEEANNVATAKVAVLRK